jgi:hypothetical protein
MIYGLGGWAKFENSVQEAYVARNDGWKRLS